MSLSKFTFITLIFLSGVCWGYTYQFQAEYKGGSRHIGRLNLFAPVWQKGNQLIHIDTIGMISKSPVKELNVGAGYRRMTKILSFPVIVGGYAFGDIKKTPNKNTAYQITGGFEVLGTKGEFRANGYLPVGKKEFTLSSSTETDIFHDGSNIYFGDITRKKVEKILGGFDLEAGYKLPRLPVNIYAGFYHFGKDSVSINGGRARLEYKPLNWLVAGGEYSYDKERDHTWFLNLAVRLKLTGTPDTHSPFSLKGKMTQMSVRDMDIMTAVRDTQETSPDTRLAAQVTNPDELERAIKSGKPIAITADIDFGGEVVGYRYASPSAPIKNGVIAGVKVTKQGGKITSVEFSQVKLSNYTVQQQVGSPVVHNFNGMQDINLAGALFPWVENTKLSYLTLDNWQIDNAAGSGSGLVGYCKNCVIRNLVNMRDIDDDNSSGIIQVADNTRIVDCKNHGEISGDNSAGIASILSNDARAESNANSGEISGVYSAGIAFILSNDARAESNTNSGEISGNNSAGIALAAQGGAVVDGNTNSGEISGNNSAGIVAMAINSATVSENTNNGNIGTNGSGIIHQITSDTNTVANNTNTGTVAAGGSPIVSSNIAGIDVSTNVDNS